MLPMKSCLVRDLHEARVAVRDLHKYGVWVVSYNTEYAGEVRRYQYPPCRIGIQSFPLTIGGFGASLGLLGLLGSAVEACCLTAVFLASIFNASTIRAQSGGLFGILPLAPRAMM